MLTYWFFLPGEAVLIIKYLVFHCWVSWIQSTCFLNYISRLLSLLIEDFWNHLGIVWSENPEFNRIRDKIQDSFYFVSLCCFTPTWSGLWRISLWPEWLENKSISLSYHWSTLWLSRPACAVVFILEALALHTALVFICS